MASAKSLFIVTGLCLLAGLSGCSFKGDSGGSRRDAAGALVAKTLSPDGGVGQGQVAITFSEIHRETRALEPSRDGTGLQNTDAGVLPLPLPKQASFHISLPRFSGSNVAAKVSGSYRGQVRELASRVNGFEFKSGVLELDVDVFSFSDLLPEKPGLGSILSFAISSDSDSRTVSLSLRTPPEPGRLTWIKPETTGSQDSRSRIELGAGVDAVLVSRVEIANPAGPDVVLSIHHQVDGKFVRAFHSSNPHNTSWCGVDEETRDWVSSVSTRFLLVPEGKAPGEFLKLANDPAHPGFKVSLKGFSAARAELFAILDKDHSDTSLTKHCSGGRIQYFPGCHRSCHAACPQPHDDPDHGHGGHGGDACCSQWGEDRNDPVLVEAGIWLEGQGYQITDPFTLAQSFYADLPVQSEHESGVFEGMRATAVTVGHVEFGLSEGNEPNDCK